MSASFDVYLVRHGEALSERLDPARALSEDGRREVARAARFLAALGVQVRVVHHSGKTRARETAEIVADALEPRPEVRERAGLAPNDDPEVAREWLEGEGENAIVAGHLPHLDRLIALLVSARSAPLFDLATGQVVCLRRQDHHWTIRWAVNPWILERGGGSTAG